MADRRILILFIVLFCTGLLISSFFDRGQAESVQGSVCERIICMNPAATETIFKLGCQDRLVGVSDFCDYPPQAKEHPKVGAVMNPNLERLKVLKPDLLIIMGKGEVVADFCARNGVEVLRVNMGTFEEMYRDIEALGERLGCSEKALQLCKEIQTQISEVEKSVAGLSKKRVFISLYRSPGNLGSISTAGPKTLLSELVSIAGGENIFNDIQQSYPMISKESVLKRDPQVIIEPLQQTLIADADRLRENWSDMSDVEAVKNSAIYFPDADLVLKPGPRVGTACKIIAKIIHPEAVNE